MNAPALHKIWIGLCISLIALSACAAPVAPASTMLRPDAAPTAPVTATPEPTSTATPPPTPTPDFSILAEHANNAEKFNSLSDQEKQDLLNQYEQKASKYKQISIAEKGVPVKVAWDLQILANGKTSPVFFLNEVQTGKTIAIIFTDETGEEVMAVFPFQNERLSEMQDSGQAKLVIQDKMTPVVVSVEDGRTLAAFETITLQEKGQVPDKGWEWRFAPEFFDFTPVLQPDGTYKMSVLASPDPKETRLVELNAPQIEGLRQAVVDKDGKPIDVNGDGKPDIAYFALKGNKWGLKEGEFAGFFKPDFYLVQNPPIEKSFLPVGVLGLHPKIISQLNQESPPSQFALPFDFKETKKPIIMQQSFNIVSEKNDLFFKIPEGAKIVNVFQTNKNIEIHTDNQSWGGVTVGFIKAFQPDENSPERYELILYLSNQVRNRVSLQAPQVGQAVLTIDAKLAKPFSKELVDFYKENRDPDPFTGFNADLVSNGQKPDGKYVSVGLNNLLQRNGVFVSVLSSSE